MAYQERVGSPTPTHLRRGSVGGFVPEGGRDPRSRERLCRFAALPERGRGRAPARQGRDPVAFRVGLLDWPRGSGAAESGHGRPWDRPAMGRPWAVSGTLVEGEDQPHPRQASSQRSSRFAPWVRKTPIIAAMTTLTIMLSVCKVPAK